MKGSAMNMLSALVIVWAMICAVCEASASCTSTSQCAEDECCMHSMGRYSTPTCTKLRELGSQCRPNNPPSSPTFYYPGGTQVQLTDIYYSVCNCSHGLVCSRSTGTCEKR